MTIELICGACPTILSTLEDNSIDLIVTDPPYYKVKNVAWDRQWATAEEYLTWLDDVLAEFYRLLRPNGSLYLFASPSMAARVECKIAERFNVLTNIRWVKEAGWHNKTVKEELRSYLTPSEAIIFAEHYGADGYAKGEAGYSAKCDELRGFVFEPLRVYLGGEKERAGWTTRQVAEAFQGKTGSRTVTGMAGHWFSQVQWTLPTEGNYQWLRDLFNADGSEFLRRDYEDLRREYEDLRRDYEDLRRPFTVTADVPYTDVWTFKTVTAYPGKHPCEKPLDMIEHIIRSSSREGAVVLDGFCGSGVVGVAAEKLGRDAILIDANEHWVDDAKRRTVGAQQQPRML